MTGTLHRRPAVQTDLPFIEHLLCRSCTCAEEGIGYPRCDEKGELEAELKLYELALQDAFFVLEDASGTQAGTFGLFYASDLDYAFLAGPLLLGPWRDGNAMLKALDFAEEAARRLGLVRLKNAVVDENVLLTGAMTKRGWAPLGGNLEMIYDAVRRSAPAASSLAIETLSGPDDPRAPAVADLLGSTHGWKDDPAARLIECMRQGARVAYVTEGAQVVGAVVWLHLEGTHFSRIDYVSTLPERRRRGIASALVAHALRDIHAVGAQRAYLALDPANQAAHALYLAMGFQDNVRSTLFSLDMA